MKKEKGIIQDLGPDHDQKLDIELKNIIDNNIEDIDLVQLHRIMVAMVTIIIIHHQQQQQHPGIDHQDDKSLD